MIQHGAIGDVLMCTPAVRALRKHLPEAEITFLVGNKAFDAVRHNPNIDKFIVPNLQMQFLKYLIYLFRFVFSRYDIVIDFQQNPRSALITFLTFAKKRISFTEKHRNYAYNIKIGPVDTQIYAAINKLKLLKPLGINESDDSLPELFITDKERKWAKELWNDLNFQKQDLIIALSPVSIKSYRLWDLEYFAQICDFLIDKYQAKIVFTWGPGEFHIIKIIQHNMKNKIEINYKISSIKQLKAIFERSSLFLGNDNGPRHIAITCGIPTIGIFSHVHASHWTPPGMEKHLAISPEIPGIKNLKFEAAIEKIEKFMEKFYRTGR
ncbi:MAG TPA: glycosyltransferase family 9 protein [Candidatus Cloacimonetes bacterium]|nr:glycosyltransferase family 9 protein [Candidatus Cloacimonadota bacterium]